MNDDNDYDNDYDDNNNKCAYINCGKCEYCDSIGMCDNCSGYDNCDIHLICSKGNYDEFINILYTNNININIVDSFGNTCLHLVFMNKIKYEILIKFIEFFINNPQFDINKQNVFGYNILHYACYYPYRNLVCLEETFKLLINNDKININQQMLSGNTVLINLCFSYSNGIKQQIFRKYKKYNKIDRYAKMIDLLLKHKDINLSIRSKNGRTCFNYLQDFTIFNNVLDNLKKIEI